MKSIPFVIERSSHVSYSSWFPTMMVPSTEEKTQELLSTKVFVFHASDDDRGEYRPRYAIATMDIPEKVSPESYIRYHPYIQNIIRRMGKARDTYTDLLSIEQYMSLSDLSYAAQEEIFKLLATKKFRSSYRESLKNQVLSWLQGNTTHKYPLSPKQLDSITKFSQTYR